jgi:hypothetical protein
MFTDTPSPFRPRTAVRRPFALLALAAFAGWGAHSYSARVLASNQARDATRPSAQTPVAIQQDIGRSATSRRLDIDPPRPQLEARVAPEARKTIYLCKAYSGGSFWSDVTCGAQGATIDRITTVPASLPFDQQVALARGEAQEAAKLYTAAQPLITAAVIEPPAPPGNRSSLCPILDQQVRDLDAEARRGQPAWRQDQIRADRMNVMTARVRERC